MPKSRSQQAYGGGVTVAYRKKQKSGSSGICNGIINSISE